MEILPVELSTSDLKICIQ